MQKITVLEFVDKEQLDFNIYNQKNEIVYKKGDKITPDLMLMLSCTEAYAEPSEMKQPETVVVEVEPIIEPEEEKPKPAPKIDTDASNKAEQGVISTNVANDLVKNIKSILGDINAEDAPEIAVCEITKNIVIEQVKNNIDKIQTMEQLRIIDEYVYSHAINVSMMCAALSIKLGYSDKDVQDLTLAALLHDIGKIKVPKEIIDKKGPLLAEEEKIMRSHTDYGYDIIMDMNLSEKIARVALEHQEKYDGTGYNEGLKADEISIFAQITSIADTYDTLVSNRAHMKALSQQEAIKIMISESGKSFNPNLLYKFIWL